MLSSRVFLMRIATIKNIPYGSACICTIPKSTEKIAYSHMNYLNRFEYHNSTGDLLVRNASSSIICKRFYGDSKKDGPQLPSKEVVLKTSWKIVAMTWDFAKIIVLYTWNFIQKQVIENVHVQKYWEIFLKKLEEGRRSKW